MILTRTPFRVSFFGGGSDYPEWFLEHKGAVLATTIDKFAYIMVRRLPPTFLDKYRVVYREEEFVNSVDEIRHPIVREGLKLAGIKDGMEIVHWSDIPARKGMGTSSAFAVGLMTALGVRGYASAYHIERNLLKRNIGCQDSMMASLGGFLHIEFPSMEVESILPNNLSCYLLLFDTGHYREASDIAGTYSFDENVLNKMYELVGTARRYVRDRNYMAFGYLLDKTWELKKQLSSSISNREVDDMYATALKHGAVGGKVLGAGGGGYLLVFAQPDHHARIIKALDGYKHVPFKFHNKGSEVIHATGYR